MEVLNIDSFKSKVFDYETGTIWAYKGHKPAVVDFYADWCGPCRALGPVFESVAKEKSDQIDFYKINIDTTPELATLFGVRAVPSLLFIPLFDAPVINSGFLTKERLEKAINEIFSKQQSAFLRGDAR